jgi:hypothetical protein
MPGSQVPLMGSRSHRGEATRGRVGLIHHSVWPWTVTCFLSFPSGKWGCQFLSARPNQAPPAFSVAAPSTLSFLFFGGGTGD